MKKMIWLLCFGLVGFSQPVWAAANPCDQDRAKVCGDVPAGKGAVHSCMLANVGDLSPDCRKAVESSERLVQQFIQTCSQDARRFCGVEMDLRPSEVIDCMRRNKDKFPAQCQRIHKQLKAYNYPVLD